MVDICICMGVHARSCIPEGWERGKRHRKRPMRVPGPHEVFACYGPYQVEHFRTLQVSSETDEALTSRVPSVYLSHLPLVPIDV